METHKQRKTSIDRATIESLFSPGAAAPPSPQVGISPNKDYFAVPDIPQHSIRHSRSLSYAPRRPNRLSLSFPLAPPRRSHESTRATPTSSSATSFPPTPTDTVLTPTLSPSSSDSGGFLVALASQERRVLELKEELQKAEGELKKLKKQWAHHEAHKKRAEIRFAEPLQPLQTLIPIGDSSIEDESTPTRQSIELDKRKALMANMQKESRRKVITGGHTRTLSLLAPERSNVTRPFPPVQESGNETEANLPRSTTMPDTSQGITKISSNIARHSYQGGVTNGAKQIAEDVKAGLWTFLEDLRQATVGEEAVNGTTNRANLDHPQKDPSRKGSKGSLLSAEKSKRGQSPKDATRTWDTLTGPNVSLLDSGGSLWPDMEHIRPDPSKKKPGKTVSLAPAIGELDDDWSNWDSPAPKSPRWSGSTEISDPATPSHSNSNNSVK
jgi:hypothetical protein